MDAAGFRVALAALGIKLTEAPEIFGRTGRAVFYWLDERRDGPPDHVALAVNEMLAGNLAREDVKKFIKVCRSRRDGDRYEDHR